FAAPGLEWRVEVEDGAVGRVLRIGYLDHAPSRSVRGASAHERAVVARRSGPAYRSRPPLPRSATPRDVRRQWPVSVVGQLTRPRHNEGPGPKWMASDLGLRYESG